MYIQSKRLIAVILAAGSAISSSFTGVYAVNPPSQPARPEPPSEYLVGVYYFAGWWRELPNKYAPGGKDWRLEFPGRKATLGEYNEQETMDREIAAAADHGVHFFQFLWYPVWEKTPEAHAEKLNVAPTLFLNSPNRGRMYFTVEYVNHAPFQLRSDAEWLTACRLWCTWMKHPRYLRVGGRPVFKIHGLQAFVQQNDGKPAQAAERIRVLRQTARETGLAEPLVSGGVLVDSMPASEEMEPYDFLTTYMDIPPLPRKQGLYPYEQLVDYAETGWKRYATKASKPYVPYLPAGWDPRPWHDPRPSFAMPDQEQWETALSRIKASLDAQHTMGVPLPEGNRQKMLMIYAWNEFGEGGIVAPTQERGLSMLKGIHNIFRAEK